MARADVLHKGRAVKQSPFAQLRAEHHLVRRALVVLSNLANHVRLGGSFPARDVELVLRFFNEFFQGVHEVKELKSLYPAVALHGDDRVAELAGGLLRDHADTVNILHSLALFAEPSSDLADVEVTGFADAARAFVGRLKRHMKQEEDELFPIAETCVPPDDQLSMLEVFHELDSELPPRACWSAELQGLEATWGT